MAVVAPGTEVMKPGEEDQAIEQPPEVSSCPEKDSRHSYLISLSQMLPPTSTGEVNLLTIWSCPCGATKVNQVKVGKNRGGLVVAAPSVPPEMRKGGEHR